MGVLAADEPLQAAVARAALAAGASDPRFSPVAEDEIDALVIEISVLSAMSPLRFAEQLEVGRHGLQVSRGTRHGLLLPQVAIEHGWDREQFLAHACLKADLKRDAWRDGRTIVQTFTAEVFTDPDTPSPKPEPS